jgi:soluble lytic murein transglycosylase
LSLLIGRGLLAFVAVAVATPIAGAQTVVGAQAVAGRTTAAAYTLDDAPPAQPVPYTPTPAPAPDDAPPAQPVPYTPYTPPAPVMLPIAPTISGLSASDQANLAAALNAARRGDGAGAQTATALITDPVARKLALWATVDAEGEQLGFFRLDQARKDLAGWPRSTRRQCAAEKLVETSGLSPQAVVAWFQGAEPVSPQGAMALAAAYEQLGRRPDAQALIRRWWRGKAFDADLQRTMLSRFGDLLTQDDHVVRVDALLYGAQGQAARDLLSLLPADQQAAAQARMALRADSSGADALAGALPTALAQSSGVAVERARYLQKHGLDALALPLVSEFPAAPPSEDAAQKIWAERKLLINAAMRAQDYRAAYAAATNHGLTTGQEYTEAEFYAGWLALSKLRDPAAADAHFANIQAAGVTPITLARAFYWRGRAAEARGDKPAAKAFYAQGAKYDTTFYGQLAAEKAGEASLRLGRDPVLTAADRAAFDAKETTRAAEMLAQSGQREMFRCFVLFGAETAASPAEAAQLVDLARGQGDQDLAMRAVRLAAQHDIVLPERGYPLRSASVDFEAADPAMVYGVIRQESGFDPRVRSGAGARGMMQLMPVTAKILARRLGEPFSAGMLDDADYNIRLGSAYIGNMINEFGGSYLMAAAGYNAGPGRPLDWAGYCGDPRASGVDPVDFIECIPFSETRNYVMRVLEGAQVYRARLHGGSAAITLAEDLKRGGYLYSRPTPLPLTPLTPTVPAYPAVASEADDPIGQLLEQ